jgi:DNA polymerase
MLSDLNKLIADVEENLLFMQELGVSDMEMDADALPAPKRAAKPANDLKPVISAPPEIVETKREVKTVPVAPAAPSRSLRETLEASKRSRSPASETGSGVILSSTPAAENAPVIADTAPAESLFGDISPGNELAASDETLEGIHGAIAGCKLCRLWEGRTQIVNSTGNPNAKLMFIGEAPGADEDAQGKPFIGRAGQLLTKIIEAIGMSREEVFIGNINRCRPPGNRAPMADEAATCKPFLLREIAVIRPQVIVVLGATAMQNLLETKAPIGKLRGNFQDYFGIRVMPTFHPAYLLRDPHKKREVWDDMKKVKAVLDSIQ